MIAEVKDQSGTKTLKPISGAIPTGNPVGTLLTTYKKIQPRNYLYCDGSTFNASQYPALYLYLGTNVLPDFQQEPNYVYIKAVDGVDISDEDTFLDTVKNFVEEKNSYSTTEMLTGGKWIDGKPIYRKVWSGLSVGVSAGTWQNLNLSNLPSIDNLVKGVAIRSVTGDKYVYNFISFRWYNSILYYKSTNAEAAITDIIIEYTKTTD